MADLFLGVDVGFGETKAVLISKPTIRRQVSIPTAITPLAVEMISGLNSRETHYEFNGKKYLAGTDAVFSGTSLPTRNVHFLIDNSAIMIAAILDKIPELNDVKTSNLCVCAGLPLEFYADYKQALKESISDFSINGKKFKFKSVSIMAQGEGVLYDYAIDENFKLRSSVDGSNMVVIDVGYNTVDVLIVNQGSCSSHHSQMLESAGICKATKMLESHVKSQIKSIVGMSAILTEQDLKQCLKQKFFVFKGERIEFADICAEIIREYSAYLYAEIENRFGPFIVRADRVLCAGGGAHYISNYFTEKLGEKFLFIPEKPEFANARGYGKFCSA
ncbi:MAG: ParM/StbA family protein [Desulforegulaceae bacterium]|nr:ParM/StbA family protein [Desulforegulaceae bacterium]